MAFSWDTISDWFIDEFAEDIKYGDNDEVKRAIVSGATQEQKTAGTGRYVDVRQNVRVRQSDFDTAPATGDLLTVRGLDRRVLTVDPDSTGKTWVLGIVDKHR